MTTLKVPTIHNNGTSRGDLCEMYMHAVRKVRDAITAVQNSGPHGRDYYPQDRYAIYEAIDQHRARLIKLAAVEKELTEILDAIVK